MKQVNLPKEIIELIFAYAKLKNIEPALAGEKLIICGYNRLTTLSRYGDKKKKRRSAKPSAKKKQPSEDTSHDQESTHPTD